MSARLRVDLITLGDELLLGIRQNSHLAFIGSTLARHGLTLRRNICCRDSRDAIVETFREAWMTADVVITTGGLGPTSDDNTREVIAHCLGIDLHYEPKIEAAIQARFDKLGRKMSENNRRQCWVPDGGEILENPYGTAPGLYLCRGGKHLFMLPGPASELIPMFESQVMARLCGDGLCNLDGAYLQLRTCGIGESHLDEKLSPLMGDNPGLGLAYCAHQGIVDVRFFAETPDLNRVKLERIAGEARAALGEDVFAKGHDSLAKVVFDRLRAQERTLAVAESCTGGQLSNSFVDIPGASKVFLGGIVCYNNDAKRELLGVPDEILQQHGAVSAECAVAMATGVAERLDADYAIAITGFAGPSGGTPQNPVGTIYIGYYSPVGTWCMRMMFPGERHAVKERAVTRALDFMRRKIEKFCVEEAFCSMKEVDAAPALFIH